MFNLYRPANRVTVAQLSVEDSAALLDQSSLTERLIACSQQSFAVEVISQGFAKPRLDEAIALGLSPSRHCLIREVKLWVDDQPWVYARSVIPTQSLHGALGFLKKLRNSALGALLFKDPKLQRSQFEIFSGNLSQLCAAPAALQLAEQKVISRRSVFVLRRQPLLVAETFLSDCLL
ncbi:MAG: chorismate lyase [Pseudomonadales bacterium]|nr:chorismate lyase [Pseudomonadales bacterium]